MLNWVSSCDMIKFHGLFFHQPHHFTLYKLSVYNGIECCLGPLFCIAEPEIILNCIYPGLCHTQETKLLR